MKIQISTDYAIRILQYLHEDKGGLHTAMHIAEIVGITYPFFIKIANMLKKKRLLYSVQGRNGGYRLGRPAHKISIYDVFLAIEGELQISPCLKHQDDLCTSGHKRDCKFRSFLQALQDDLIITPMMKMRISDLAHAVEDKTATDYPEHREASDGELLELKKYFLPTMDDGAVIPDAVGR